MTAPDPEPEAVEDAEPEVLDDTEIGSPDAGETFSDLEEPAE